MYGRCGAEQAAVCLTVRENCYQIQPSKAELGKGEQLAEGTAVHVAKKNEGIVRVAGVHEQKLTYRKKRTLRPNL